MYTAKTPNVGTNIHTHYIVHTHRHTLSLHRQSTETRFSATFSSAFLTLSNSFTPPNMSLCLRCFFPSFFFSQNRNIHNAKKKKDANDIFA